jgi:iron complex outermembrane receptor protein
VKTQYLVNQFWFCHIVMPAIVLVTINPVTAQEINNQSNLLSTSKITESPAREDRETGRQGDWETRKSDLKFVNTASALLAQGITKVTGVTVNQTAEGLEVILKTAGGEQLVPLILPEGNNLVIDILDATLALPTGNEFRQANPTEGITEVTVTQIDKISIRLTIIGETQAPTAEVIPSPANLVLSVTPEASTVQTEPSQEQEIFVTAQKIEESLQEVPLSITAFTEEDLEDAQISSFRGIADNTPNFSILDAAGSRYFVYYSIRGISNFNFSNRDAVGFYIDDVPYDYGGFLNLNLPDLERVEVLRGPQNILYGRSSIAGAINIITRRPSNELEFNGQISYGNYDDFEVQGSLSGPVVKDKLLLRLSGSYGSRDGYIRNIFLDEDIDNQSGGNGRAKLLWLPSENWEIDLSASFEDYRDGGPPLVLLDRPDPFEVEHNVSGFNDLISNAQSIKAVYNGQNLSFTSITARRFSKTNQESEIDFTPTDIGRVINQFDSTVISQELRLQSPGDGRQFQWIIGGYFESKQFNTDDDGLVFGNDAEALFGFPAGSSNLSNSETEEITLATFGQVSYQPVDPLTLSLGLRYESNNSKLKTLNNFFRTPDGLETLNFSVTDLEQDSDALLPRFAIQYNLNPDLMAYGSITRGYRPAGVNFSADTDSEEVLRFDAERSWNYEVGLKSSWLNNRLTANLALFHNTVDNFQVVLFNEFLQSERITNADARITGAELEVRATPVGGLDVIAGFGFADTEFKDYTNPITGENFSGNNLLFSPSLTYNLALQYRSVRGILGRVELVGSGKTYFTEDNNLTGDPYAIVNVRLGYEFDNYGIYLFGNNIFDKNYVTTAFRGLPGFGDFGSYGAPATYGVQFSAEF